MSTLIFRDLGIPYEVVVLGTQRVDGGFINQQHDVPQVRTGHRSTVIFDCVVDVPQRDFAALLNLFRKIEKPFNKDFLDMLAFGDRFDEKSMGASW